MKTSLRLLIVSIILLPLFASAENRPTRLMTDLVSDAGALYQNGYRATQAMQELRSEEFEQYQYAAIRSSQPTFRKSQT